MERGVIEYWGGERRYEWVCHGSECESGSPVEKLGADRRLAGSGGCVGEPGRLVFITRHPNCFHRHS